METLNITKTLKGASVQSPGITLKQRTDENNRSTATLAIPENASSDLSNKFNDEVLAVESLTRAGLSHILPSRLSIKANSKNQIVSVTYALPKGYQQQLSELNPHKRRHSALEYFLSVISLYSALEDYGYYLPFASLSSFAVCEKRKGGEVGLCLLDFSSLSRRGGG